MFFYGCPYTMCTVQYNISMFLLLIYSHWSASPRTIASFPFASDKYVDLSKASANQPYGGAKAISFFLTAFGLILSTNKLRLIYLPTCINSHIIFLYQNQPVRFDSFTCSSQSHMIPFPFPLLYPHQPVRFDSFTCSNQSDMIPFPRYNSFTVVASTT